MEFTEALQEFLFHQGFQRIKYDSKILWGKDANGKLSLLEIVPPVLPGQKKMSLEQREREMADIERQIIDTETGSAGYRGKKRSRKLSGCMVF